jgi:hypothetical protein
MSDMSEPTTVEVMQKPEPKARKRGNDKAVALASEAPAPVRTSEPPSLLTVLNAVVTDPAASMDRMNAAFDFYQRIEAAAARKAFEAAMANAKAEFDPIVKRNLVDYVNKDGKRTTYKHEDLADVSAAVDPVLAKHGLSTRYRTTSNPNEPITCTCIVAHRDGHFEETTLSAGADTSGGKNSIQAISSTLTYLQRMTKKAALGLAAARDDDGQTADARPTERITEAQAKDLEAKATRANIELQIIYEHFKVSSLAELTPAQYKTALAKINKKLELEGAA